MDTTFSTEDIDTNSKVRYTSTYTYLGLSDVCSVYRAERLIGLVFAMSQLQNLSPYRLDTCRGFSFAAYQTV